MAVWLRKRMRRSARRLAVLVLRSLGRRRRSPAGCGEAVGKPLEVYVYVYVCMYRGRIQATGAGRDGEGRRVQQSSICLQSGEQKFGWLQCAVLA